MDLVVIDTIEGNTSDAISDTSRLPFAVLLSESELLSVFASLSSESAFFSDFA